MNENAGVELEPWKTNAWLLAERDRLLAVNAELVKALEAVVAFGGHRALTKAVEQARAALERVKP